MRGTVAALDTAKPSKKGAPPPPRVYNLGNTHPVNVTSFVSTLEGFLMSALDVVQHATFACMHDARCMMFHNGLLPTSLCVSSGCPGACFLSVVPAKKEYVAVPGTGDVLFTHADVTRRAPMPANPALRTSPP